MDEKITNVELKVAGVTFSNEDGSSRKAAILEMAKDSIAVDGDLTWVKVELVREPENAYDINAIKIITNGNQIGYIGKEYAAIIAPKMDMGEIFTATVKECGEYKSRPFCVVIINQQ